MQKSVEPGSNIVYTEFVKIKKRLLLSSAGQAAPGSRFSLSILRILHFSHDGSDQIDPIKKIPVDILSAADPFQFHQDLCNAQV